uniref:Zinc finger protein 708-like n=1 Tax=Hippocampus comes TaxID=109280 RepID=A0A3Q2YCU4_HIPCM
MTQLCSKCGEGFSGTWALKTHMLVHGVEKPFMCDLCGKTFFYNCQLQKHQLVVHGNKEHAKAGGAFSCKTCAKSFSSKHRCGDELKSSRESGSKRKKEKSAAFPWSDGFVNE